MARRSETSVETLIEGDVEGNGSVAGASQRLEPGERIALYLEPAKLPRLEVTDGGGVTRFRTVGLAELLTLLDKSAVLDALEQEAIRTTLTPELPERTLFAGVIETPQHPYGVARDIIATGWLPPRQQPFVLDGRSYIIDLPVLVWRAVWREAERRLASLRLAVASPGAGVANAGTELYRWPFANVYFGNGFSEACWYTMRQIEMDFKDIVSRGVHGFLSVTDNGDLFGRGQSQNSPHADYAEFLAAAESGGLRRDWLIPHLMTVQQFHEQTKASGR